MAAKPPSLAVAYKKHPIVKVIQSIELTEKQLHTVCIWFHFLTNHYEYDT